MKEENNKSVVSDFMIELVKSAYYQSKVKTKDDILDSFIEDYKDFLKNKTSDDLYNLYIHCFEAIDDLGFVSNITKILSADKDLLKYYKSIKKLMLDEVVYKLIEYKASQL